MPGIDHGRDQPILCNKAASLVECAQGTVAFGNDTFVSPGQVAQVKHHHLDPLMVLMGNKPTEL